MIDKAALRRELLKRRDAMTPEVRKEKDAGIHERLSSLVEIVDSDVLLLFASFRTEVDTLSLIEKFLAAGKRIILPKVIREHRLLILYELRDMSELAPGYMGIPEPSLTSDERRCRIAEMDAAVIPGAGFDLSCNRIGYGGGYYDKLLSGLDAGIPLICPAYEEQIVEAIPAEPHDRKINIVVTDKRVIRCTK